MGHLIIRLPGSHGNLWRTTKTDSLETFPHLYRNQSTFPPSTFQSAPRTSSNSSRVKPGGSLLISSLSLGAVALAELLLLDRGAFFWVADEEIGRMQLADDLEGAMVGSCWTEAHDRAHVRCLKRTRDRRISQVIAESQYHVLVLLGSD